jgi:flagellin-like protein
MFNKKLRMNKKAVSPIIATLLLVAIAVSAAVVTYTWTMSMVTNQATQAQTQIKIDVVQFGKIGDATDAATITVRNTGTMAATIDQAYIMTGTTVSQTGILSTSTSERTIAASDVQNIGVIFDSLTPNTAYQIRLITTTGYVVEGVYYTPTTLTDYITVTITSIEKSGDADADLKVTMKITNTGSIDVPIDVVSLKKDAGTYFDAEDINPINVPLGSSELEVTATFQDEGDEHAGATPYTVQIKTGGSVIEITYTTP